MTSHAVNHRLSEIQFPPMMLERDFRLGESKTGVPNLSDLYGRVLATYVSGFIGLKTTRPVKYLSLRVRQPSPRTQLNEILIGLGGLYSRCRDRDWDGYDADPITEEHIISALKLVKVVIDAGLPMPEFGAEPDGVVVLDWYGANRSVISISVDLSGQLDWASVLPDGNRFSGTRTFEGRLDDDIKQAIEKIIA